MCELTCFPRSVLHSCVEGGPDAFSFGSEGTLAKGLGEWRKAPRDRELERKDLVLEKMLAACHVTGMNDAPLSCQHMVFDRQMCATNSFFVVRCAKNTQGSSHCMHGSTQNAVVSRTRTR